MSTGRDKSLSAAAAHRGELSESGIDLTLLRERLKLTVTERWERNRRSLETVEAFREAGRARRGEAAAPSD